MKWKIGNVEIENQVVLAPMAGISNIAYRKIAKEAGAGLVCNEMVSDKALAFENEKTYGMLKSLEMEHPVSMQVFGATPSSVAEAAKILDLESDCDIIDINMGCPVKKINKSGAGAILMADPENIYNIVKLTVESVNKPVTAKIRLGVDHEHINCVEVAKLIEKAGASAITIHGRTKTDMYSGKANLDLIKEVVEAVNIPVIGNGDIFTYQDAVKMLEYTGCAAVMVARGALGNPWIFTQIRDYLDGKEVREYIPYHERKAMMIYHYNLLKEYKSEHLALLEMRGHAAWYVKGLKHNSAFKQRLNVTKTEEEFFKLLDDFEDLLEGE